MMCVHVLWERWSCSTWKCKTVLWERMSHLECVSVLLKYCHVRIGLAAGMNECDWLSCEKNHVLGMCVRQSCEKGSYRWNVWVCIKKAVLWERSCSRNDVCERVLWERILQWECVSVFLKDLREKSCCENVWVCGAVLWERVLQLECASVLWKGCLVRKLCSGNDVCERVLWERVLQWKCGSMFLKTVLWERSCGGNVWVCARQSCEKGSCSWNVSVLWKGSLVRKMLQF